MEARGGGVQWRRGVEVWVQGMRRARHASASHAAHVLTEASPAAGGASVGAASSIASRRPGEMAAEAATRAEAGDEPVASGGSAGGASVDVVAGYTREVKQNGTDCVREVGGCESSSQGTEGAGALCGARVECEASRGARESRGGGEAVRMEREATGDALHQRRGGMLRAGGGRQEQEVVSPHLALSLAHGVEPPRLGAVVRVVHAAEKREALDAKAEVSGATVAATGGERGACRAEIRDVLAATGVTRGQDTSGTQSCCGG